MYVFLTRFLAHLKLRYTLFAVVFMGTMLYLGCNDDYDLARVNSPDPGIIQIYIKSDDADRQIIIAGNTFTVGDSPSDSLSLTVEQARAYSDSNWAVIYQNLTEYRELDSTYNIIKLDSVGAYQEFLIYESWLPPKDYDSLKIRISAEWISIGWYGIPIEMLTGAEYMASFYDEFEIHENMITEIHLVLKPFESMLRVKNTYQFLRLITVNEILYLPY